MKNEKNEKNQAAGEVMMAESEEKSFDVHLLHKINQKGIVPGLERIEGLLKILHNPQDKVPVIHIAGTNGKGSVLAYISTVLQTAGYKVGRYSSPAVFSEQEPFQVNGTIISEADYKIEMQIVLQAAGQLQLETGMIPTRYELETAMAFHYFHEQKCDIAVIETGLGGRLDATNVVSKPLCCVLTSISMDHGNILGNCLENIAFEKCGIIKPGAVVVSAPQKPEAQTILHKVCQEKNCELTLLKQRNLTKIQYGLEKQSFCFQQSQEIYKISITVSGVCQIENAAIALMAVLAVSRRGFPVLKSQILEGFHRTAWIGRFSKIGEGPDFYIDGAHNEEAACKLSVSLKEYFKDRRLIGIAGMLSDKEYKKIGSYLAPCFYEIITVTPKNDRALSGKRLRDTLMEYHDNVTEAKTIADSVSIAYEKAGKADIIIAFGSLSFLKDIKSAAEKRQKEI